MKSGSKPQSLMLKLFKTPLIGMVLCFVLSTIFFIVFITSNFGKVTTKYHASVLQWQATNPEKLLKITYFGFNIMPTY